MDDKYQENTEATACLRFISPLLNHDLITKQIVIKPHVARNKGDANIKKPGKTFPTGVWILESKLLRTAPLADHIMGLLDSFELKKEILRNMANDGLIPSLMCGVFSNGGSGNYFLLNQEVIKRIAEIGAILEIRFYELPKDWQAPQKLSRGQC